MTLTTHVAIGAPVPVAKLHRELNRLLVDHTPGWQGGVDGIDWCHEPDGFYGDGRWEYRNTLGQGLCALAWVCYVPEGWLSREPDEDGYSFYDGLPADMRVMAEYALDTPYGAGSDTQRAVITELAPWLEAHDAPWWWHDEGWGEWRPPSEFHRFG